MVKDQTAGEFVDTLTKLRSKNMDPMGIGALMTKILVQRRKAASGETDGM